jgi:membrane protein
MRLLWKSLLGTIKGIFEHDCHGLSTQIAYHWIYALFPGLFVLLGVVTALGENRGFLTLLGSLIESATPGDTRPLVAATLEAMSQALARGSAPVLGIGLVGVLWVASNGFDVIMSGLNRAYRVTEFRPFWYRRLLSAVLVVAVGFGLITAFEILVVGSSLVRTWLLTLPSPPDLPGLIGWARWPTYFIVACAVGTALYAIAPALPRVDWRWTLPGAVLFGLLWMLIGYGFDRYLSLYGRMDKLYGILGAFLVLMTWLYLTAFAFMAGGELNGQVRWRYLEQPLPGHPGPGHRSRGTTSARIAAVESRAAAPPPASTRGTPP